MRTVSGTSSTSLADAVRPVVLQYIKDNPQAFEPNQYGRRFMRHVPIDRALVASAFSQFGIDTLYEEPIFGNFIGNNYADGAFVHSHKDPAPEGFHHVRCNLALEMPIVGGNPLLDGKEIEVKRGDMWICFASIEEHSTTPILGGERLVLSMGALVEEGTANKVYETIRSTRNQFKATA